MNHHPMHLSVVLVMHQDPILGAGVVSALRGLGDFHVLVHGVDWLGPGALRVDVLVADYAGALRLADVEARHALGLGDARVLALTANDRENDIRRALEAGVHGYVLVGGPLSELVDGVKAVARGARYMNLSVAQRVAESLTRAALTARETEVLRLLVAGQSNKEIARHLRIELGTVKSHVSAIMAKLGASSRTQAAGIAAARGLVEDAPEQGGRRVPAPQAGQTSPASRPPQPPRALQQFTG